MNNAIAKGIEAFARENINTVYNSCYFQLIEERTSIIYENSMLKVRLKLYVEGEADSGMIITDMDTDEATVINATESGLVCEDDNIDVEFCNEIIGRYLNLMEAFVQFAKYDS